MDRHQWRQTVSRDEAQRRAVGRSRHNLERKRKAELRMLHVAELLVKLGAARGALSQIARILEVNRGTISRDVVALRKSGWDQRSQWERLDRISKLVRWLYYDQRRIAAFYRRAGR